jgi:hypothetical protein
MCARELALVQEGNGVTYMGRRMNFVKRVDGSIAVAGTRVSPYSFAPRKSAVFS